MSLLKRIEQGQGGSSSGGQSSDAQGGGEGSRLSSLQARRVNAPITSPQAGAPTIPVPTSAASLSMEPTLRGFS